MAYLPKKIHKLYHSWQKKDDNKFYSSSKWRSFRAAYLKRHPLCIDCKKIDITMKATVIDHILPIKQGGAIWDETNLQPLCYVHHSKKSAKDGHRMRGRGGLNF